MIRLALLFASMLASPAAADQFWRREAMEPGSLDPLKASTVTGVHVLHDPDEQPLACDGESTTL